MTVETQLLVTSRYDRADEYRREHEIRRPHCVIVHTDNATATSVLRGKRLSRDQIHYVDGWDEGKYANQVQADIITMLALSDV